MADNPLTKTQIIGLRRMMETDAGWDALLLAYGNYVDRIGLESVGGTDAFSTLKDLHMKQGGVEHLRTFLEEVQRMKIPGNE